VGEVDEITECYDLGMECLKEYVGPRNVKEAPPFDDASRVLVAQERIECSLDQLTPISLRSVVVDFLERKIPAANGGRYHNLRMTFENPGAVRTGKCYLQIFCWDYASTHL